MVSTIIVVRSLNESEQRKERNETWLTTNAYVRPELQSRVNNGCIAFIQSPMSPVVIDDQSRTDSA